MKIDLTEKTSGFSILTGDKKGFVSFLSAPIDAYIRGTDESASFLLRKEVPATVYQEPNGNIIISAFRETVFPISFAIKFNGFDFHQEEINTLVMGLGDETIVVSVIEGGTLAPGNNGSCQITMTGPTMTIVLDLMNNNFSKSSFNAMSLETPDAYGPLDYVPQFSIGVFDHYNPNTKAFIRPRPLRLGVPVISTLPTQGVSLEQDEQDYLESGIAPEERTLHFRIVSSRILESGFNEGDLSELKLKLWLPSGLDTVGLPIDVPMYYLGTDSDLGQIGPQASQSVYRASYTFHKEYTKKHEDG